MKKLFFAASFVLYTVTSFGAGYQINLEGLRQLAMGGTGTAIPWDASTMFYNPAGLVRLKNIQVYGSMSFVMPTTGFSSTSTTQERSVSQTFTPFNFYIGGRVKEGSPLALGLGIYTPFGTGLQWNDNWEGRYIVQSTQLSCIFVQPTISYRVGEFLSIGAGFIYANGTVDIKQAMPVQNILGNDATASLHGDASGVGFNSGIHLKFSDGLQMGFTYRSKINMAVDGGAANFTVPVSLNSSFPNTTFKTSLPLPWVGSFGLGIRPDEFLTIQFDLNYTGWNSYDSLKIDFAANTSSLKNNHAPRHYQNTLTPRIGACYKISRTVAVMMGFAYDPTPVTDGFVSPDLPDSDRYLVTCGASVKPFPGVTILAAIEATSSAKRAGVYNFGQFSGTYQTLALAPGIGLYYNF